MSQVVHADAGDNDTKHVSFFKLFLKLGPYSSLTTCIPILASLSVT